MSEERVTTDDITVHAVAVLDEKAEAYCTDRAGGLWTYTIGRDFGEMLGTALRDGVLDETVDLPARKFTIRREGWPGEDIG